VCPVITDHGAAHGDKCTADSGSLAADRNTDRHSGTANGYPDTNGDSHADPTDAHAQPGDRHGVRGGL
jgi:hypothetical protein